MSTAPTLASREAAVVGALLESNGGELPPTMARLLAHAPESFDDLAHGKIAVAIRQLKQAGKPVHSLAVVEAVTDLPGASILVGNLLQSAIGIEIAEVEAMEIWKRYHVRRLQSLFGDSAAALIADPRQAENIAARVRSEMESLSGEARGIREKLTAVRFDILAPQPEEASIFRIGNATIATRGNISALTAQAKAGKSAWIAAMIASGITPRPDECDLLGVRAVNPDGLPLLLLDTEHSPFHHHFLCDRILRRAMLTESGQLHAYRLAGFSVADLTAALKHLLGERQWLAAILDGTGDFVADVNDPGECNGFVAWLHGLAIDHDTHILNVLHLNPASDFKSRGHLGSQLERKAESNIRIEKADEISVVFADKNRGVAIPKHLGPCFQWSDERGMHVSIQNQLASKDSIEKESLSALFADVFSDHPAMRYSDLIVTVKTRLKVVDRTAERKVASAVRLGVIEKSVAGLYTLTT